MEPNNSVPPAVRLKELLAVPDKDRTEEEWDELIELEIMLAPENRLKKGASRNDSRNDSGHQPGQGNGRRPNKRPGKKRHNHKQRRQPEQASSK